MCAWQVEPRLHRPHALPPQSTSLSSPFTIPSAQVVMAAEGEEVVVAGHDAAVLSTRLIPEVASIKKREPSVEEPLKVDCGAKARPRRLFGEVPVGKG